MAPLDEGLKEKILDLHPPQNMYCGAIRGIGLQAQGRCRKARPRMPQAFVEPFPQRAPALGRTSADTSAMINVDAMQKP